MKYGTVASAILGAVVLAGGYAEYAIRWHVYAEDMAVLMEAISERENVAGGITTTNTIAPHVCADDLLAIDQRVEALCADPMDPYSGPFVDERFPGTDLGWNASASNYVRWTFANLCDYVASNYFPSRHGTNLLELGWHVYAEDFRIRWQLISQLTSTVANCSFGCGRYRDYVDDSFAGAHDYGATGDETHDTQQVYQCDADEELMYQHGAPTGAAWRGESAIDLSDSVTCGPSLPQVHDDSQCERPPSYAWWAKYIPTWRRYHNVQMGAGYLQTYWYDQSSDVLGGEWQEWTAALSVAIPARQVPIGGTAVFRWGGDVYESVYYTTNSTQTNTATAVGPGIDSHVENFACTVELPEALYSTCSEAGTVALVSRDTADVSGSGNGVEVRRSGAGTNDLRNPVKLTWAFEYCVH